MRSRLRQWVGCMRTPRTVRFDCLLSDLPCEGSRMRSGRSPFQSQVLRDTVLTSLLMLSPSSESQARSAYLPDGISVNATGPPECSHRAGISIHLRTLSDARSYPNARKPSMGHSWGDTWPTSISSVLMTSFRLAVLMGGDQRGHLIVMDWRNAQILYVREFLFITL